MNLEVEDRTWNDGDRCQERWELVGLPRKSASKSHPKRTSRQCQEPGLKTLLNGHVRAARSGTKYSIARNVMVEREEGCQDWKEVLRVTRKWRCVRCVLNDVLEGSSIEDPNVV